MRFKSRARQIGHSCKRLATAATFLRRAVLPAGVMTREWTPPTRYTLQRHTAARNERFDAISKNQKEIAHPSKWHFRLTLFYIRLLFSYADEIRGAGYFTTKRAAASIIAKQIYSYLR